MPRAKFSGLNDRRKPENPLAGGSYQTSDDRWLLLAFVESDKIWPVFTKSIGRDDLTVDGRFADSKGRAANAAVSGGNSERGRLFVHDLSGGHVLSMNPDGSDKVVIVSECRNPDGIVVDVETSYFN